MSVKIHVFVVFHESKLESLPDYPWAVAMYSILLNRYQKQQFDAVSSSLK